MHSHSFIFIFLSLVQILYAIPVSSDALLLRVPNDSGLNRLKQRQASDSQCINTPTSRRCWTDGFDVDTDQETSWPNTGRIVTYNLEVQNLTLAPDGVPRPVYGINGQYPGPVIRANWGDTLQITVTNSLQNNGTSMHWHGVRQWQSNPMDGTNGITECPLAPGESRTYTFLATQYGTSWYHSHHATQSSDGVLGPIIIDGPATADYDVDLGTMPITDWSYETAASTIYKISRNLVIGSPAADNILINGTNVNSGNVLSATGPGAYHRNTLEKDKKYRLRMINTATHDNYKISLDGHSLTVIAMDFVPVVPFTTDWLFIGIGQRYDLIITADQPVDSYWFHVVPQESCSNSTVTNAVSIFTYEGASSDMPSDSNRNRGPPTDDCNDPNSDLQPNVPLDVPDNNVIPESATLDVGFTVTPNSNSQGESLVQWTLNFTAIHAEWDKPTIQYVREGDTAYPPDMNLIELPNKNEWTFWVIQAVDTIPPPQPHPMHLHGHDFYILGAGTGVYDSSTSLNYKNPPRRDVAMLPASGYLVLAFKTDNPGAWLMHCHVAWHIDQGMGVQFLERADEIPALLDQTQGWNEQCSSWDQYDDTAIYKEEGSGL